MEPIRIGNLNEIRVLFIETEDSDDYKNRLTQLLEFLNGKAKLALLFNNDWIKDFADNIIEESRDTRGVELFDPWLIKGLERESVVLVGAHSASPKDPDSRGLMGVNLDNVEELGESVKSDINLMRRKMLVSSTRAISRLVILNSPKGTINFKRKDETIRNLLSKAPMPSSRFDQILPNEDFTGKMDEFFSEDVRNKDETGVFALVEGIELFERAINDEEFMNMTTNFLARLNTIFANESENSLLSMFLLN